MKNLAVPFVRKVYGSLIIVLCIMGLAAGGCSKTGMPPNTNPRAFGEHVRVHEPPSRVVFEIATLPENRPEDVGGPTDYVSLVAMATLSDVDTKDILSQPRNSSVVPIPRAFIRSWLSESDKAAMEEAFFHGTRPFYDVRTLTARPAKRALGVPVGASRWLFYVEYIAPN